MIGRGSCHLRSLASGNIVSRQATSDHAFDRTIGIAETELARQVHIRLTCKTFIQEPECRVVFRQDQTIDDSADLVA
jgi:hypothetical protein